MAAAGETFIQPKVVGYRQLSVEEATAMNEIKMLANQVGARIEHLRGTDADQRWVSIAQTQLQQGFMALVRSVAKPESF